MKQPKLGLVLPHFGEHAFAPQCLEVSSHAEIYGFHSVWVRDHLVFKPHRIEGQNNNHLEGMLLLASVASATEKIRLGTAMTICHRHPIHLAQLGASLAQFPVDDWFSESVWAVSLTNLPRPDGRRVWLIGQRSSKLI